MRKDKKLLERQRGVNLRHQEKSCHTCRYFRMNGNHGYCLFLGRTIAESNVAGDLALLVRGIICDAWKKRPSTWSVVATDNPFWFDRYITRQTQRKFRR